MHSSRGYLTPCEFELQPQPELATAKKDPKAPA
ncbi:hypothetical protein [Crateriforma spongiae]